jgi:hypothetical protein
MPNFSGNAQSQLKSALKFLALVDKDDSSRPELKKLVTAFKTEEWQSELWEVTKTAYASLMNGLDIQTDSLQALKQQFRDAGLEGATVDKAIRFFLAALTECQIPFSPHFPSARAGVKTVGRPRATREGRSAARKTAPSSKVMEKADTLLAEGTTKLPFPLPNKPITTIFLAKGISEPEWSMIDTYVRNYIKVEAANS